MKVVIKNENGEYLSGTQGEITFMERKERAYVYDYEEDKVEEQLAVAKKRYGYVWTWEALGDCEGLTGLPKTPYAAEKS